MYSRDKLGQDEVFAIVSPGTEIISLQPGEGYQAYTQFAPTGLEPPSAPPGSSWSWGDIWTGAAQVIRTGAEAFARIYPAIKGTGYPSPYPQTPTGAQIPPGYRLNPSTGRIEPVSQITAMTASPYFWPAVLGIGAFFIVSQTRRR